VVLSLIRVEANFAGSKTAFDGAGQVATIDTDREKASFGRVDRRKQKMNREEIIARLRENEATLRKRGVAHAALFGSRARGEQGPHSDTDIMIEIDPNAPVGVWEYAGIKTYIASLFEGPVDVVDREGLKSYVKPAATAEAIYAF
jgi:hypothetical protein